MKKNSFLAAAQLVGVSGREYKVYFYKTYITQLSKNKVLNKSISSVDLESITISGNEKRKFPNDQSKLENKSESTNSLVDDKNEVKKLKTRQVVFIK
jgi:hypothetical protein